MTNEALKFLEISKDYLPEDKLNEFFARLDQEFTPFGQPLKSLLDQPAPARWIKPALYVLIVVHFILVCCVGTSFFLLPFFAPWYEALPIMIFIWVFSTSKWECKLTNLENHWRKKLGMKQIGGFVGHYFKKPALILLNKIRASDRT